MKKENLDVDPQSMDNRQLSVIARNPNHPMATHAKSELQRRRIKKAELSTEGTAPKVDPEKYAAYKAKMHKPKKLTSTQKQLADIRKRANEGAMKRIATTQSNKADRIASSDKKGLETFKKREMQSETKGAPKGYHFTRDGKLRKGDAGADGPGGAKLRSDPLDKQRSKIPPLPERTETTMKSFSEISMGKMQAYGKAAAKDIDQKRNKVKAALDQPASVKHAKAGMKAMQGLTKRSRGSDMYVDKMTGRSKVKPTAEAVAETSRTMTPMKNRFGGPVDSKKFDMYKKHMKKHSLDEPTVRMAHQEPDHPESKSMMKNPKYAQALSLYKAAQKNEATIPDGQTAMTKRPELTSSDAEKLAKIRKMLDREKKK